MIDKNYYNNKNDNNYYHNTRYRYIIMNIKCRHVILSGKAEDRGSITLSVQDIDKGMLSINHTKLSQFHAGIM